MTLWTSTVTSGLCRIVTFEHPRQTGKRRKPNGQDKRSPNIVLSTFGQCYNANRKILLRLHRRNVRPAVTAFIGRRFRLHVLALLFLAALCNLFLNLLDVLIVELRGLRNLLLGLKLCHALHHVGDVARSSSFCLMVSLNWLFIEFL